MKQSNVDIETLKRAISCIEFGAVEPLTMRIDSIGKSHEGRDMYEIRVTYLAFQPEKFQVEGGDDAEK